MLLLVLFIALPAFAVEPQYTPATIETHCLLKKVRDQRYRLAIAILENRTDVFTNEASLNSLERRLFSTINQTNEVDTEESYLARLKTAFPEFTRTCRPGNYRLK